MHQLAIIFSILDMISSFPMYISDIPNGLRVPDPCPGSTGYFTAVGHWGRAPEVASSLMQGRNINHFARNPFGLHFESIKYWPALCLMDSDNDGRTNGEELGDPNCTWTKGMKLKTKATSHPGIREIFEGDTIKIHRSVNSSVHCGFQGSVSFA